MSYWEVHFLLNHVYGCVPAWRQNQKHIAWFRDLPNPNLWAKCFPLWRCWLQIGVSEATRTKQYVSFGEKCSVNIDIWKLTTSLFSIMNNYIIYTISKLLDNLELNINSTIWPLVFDLPLILYITILCIVS